MSQLRRLCQNLVVRNALLMYSVQITSYLIPLITLPYLWSVLGTRRFGLIAFAQAMAWYFTVLTEYGFNVSATRKAAQVSGDMESIARLFSAVTAAKALLTGLGLLTLVAIVFTVPGFRAEWPLFLIAFLSVVGYLLFPMWLFQGLQKMQHVAARDFAAKLLGLMALFAFVHDERDYLLAAGVQSGGFLLAGLGGLASLRFTLKVRFQWPEWAEVTRALRDGWHIFLSMAASTLLANTNIFLLGLVSPVQEVAYLAAAQRIIAAFRSLVGPISSAIYPLVSQKAARSENEAVRFVRKYSLWFTLPFAGAGMAMLLGAPLLVRIWLRGSQSDQVTLLVQVMAFSPALLALSHLYSTFYMLACGYDRQWMRILLMSVGMNFVALVPLLAFVRGSLAMAIAFTVVDVFSTLMYRRFYLRHAPRPED